MNQQPLKIAVPTRNRALGLRDCLLSYHDHFSTLDIPISYIVLDNSTEHSFFRENQTMIDELQHNYKLDILHLDQIQRHHLCFEIAHATQIPESVIQFALLGDQRCIDSYGACRNALLLSTRASLSIQVDDDTQCYLTSSSTETGLEISSKRRPNIYKPMSFLPLSQENPEDIHLYKEHVKWLGEAPLDVFAETLNQNLLPTLTHSSPKILELLSHPNATIATTYLGTVGDSGMQGHASRLFDPHEQLLASEDDFNQLMTTRWMIKSVPQTTISDSPHCMTIHIGLDTRKLLPPFMPVMRNEDGVFGAVKHVCFPHYLSAYLPYTIQHLPPEERPIPSLDEALRSPEMRTNDLVCQLVLYAKQDFAHAPSLKTLGEYLLEIASSSPDSFRQLVQDKAHQTRLNIIAFAQQQLEAYTNAPDFWTRGVHTYIDSLKKPADAFAPADIDGPFEDRWVIFQDLVHQYATLLTHWETIYTASLK